ncbi:MAG: Fis family transcriptional regulator [Pseudomonadota bacterium]|jgi:DNA-binding NtrC family response regulator
MSRGHVLVVDDEAAILSTLKKALTLEGYSVDLAGGAALATKRLEAGTYDIALLDVALPDGDGLSLLQGLRTAGNTMPVVMMSGHATIDAAVRATQLGALDFLEKPLSTDRLLLVVENALRLAKAEQESQELKRAAGYFEEIVGASPVVKELAQLVARAARSSASVLVTGERGTGKELIARALHRSSLRAHRTLEKLNCAAVPSELIESELFGHEAGAFTGATKLRRGKFERADGGTIFLDEVGDMPLTMQAKLLRVLQEREIERVGGSEVLRVDVRVIAATNKDLLAACEDGSFRADLYDRLNVVPIQLPSLRTRRDDIPELASHFIKLAQSAHGRPGVTLTVAAVTALQQHSYPGNVRELRNLIERLVILSPDNTITDSDVRHALGMAGAPRVTGLFRAGVPFRVLAEDAERTIITEALAANQHQMAATARALGLERSHLYKKAKALGIRGEVTDGADTD